MSDSKYNICVQAILFSLLVVAASWLINRFNWHATDEPLIESIVFAILLAIFVSIKPVHDFLSRIPTAHKWIGIGFIFVMAVAQFTSIGRAAFPFLPWRMYSDSTLNDQATIYQYFGADARGQKVSINPPRLFPTLGHTRLSANLHSRLNALLLDSKRKQRSDILVKGKQEISLNDKIRTFLEYKPDATYDEQKEQFNDALFAIGTMYNRIHSDHPIRSVFVERHTIRLEGHQAITSQPTRVWQVDLNRGRKP